MLSGQRTELTAQDVAITILGLVIRIEGMLFGIVVISVLYHLFGEGGGRGVRGILKLNGGGGH